ncbi:MAG: branched-chain amino acid ABC transporter permease [Burkholderiaceae bacterium]
MNAKSIRKGITAHGQQPALQMAGYSKLAALFFTALLVAMAVGPLVLPPFWVYQFTGVMAFAIAALGLNLITGYVGLISLGHNAFFALGSYVAVLALTTLGTSYVAAALIAGLVSFCVGLLAGFPAQRLRGLYLALITLVLAVSVAPLIKHFKDYTGGAAGLLFDPPQPPSWFSLSGDAWVYYMVMAFAIAAFVLVRNFVGGSTGRALAAVREGPLAASSMGVNVDFHKVLIFGVGSMLAGVGGAMQAYMVGFIGPDSFTLMLSIGFLAAIVVGGLGTIWGALVAGLFLQFVPSFASDLGQALAGAVYGGILIACMFLMPNGIVGSLIGFARKRAEAQRGAVAGHRRA